MSFKFEGLRQALGCFGSYFHAEQQSEPGIEFPFVFDQNYPVEIWEQQLRSSKPENRKGWLEALSVIAGKTETERQELVQNLTRPRFELIIGRGAREEAVRQRELRQQIINFSSMSQENLNNIVEALKNIQDFQ